MTNGGQTYAFERAGQPADARFDGLAAFYDETTQRHLAARGIGPGWRCLDIGAGGGSVAAWMSEQVGPMGHVLATDLNTDSLERVRAANLEVRPHDIVRDALPDSEFDLIHTRLVLVHLPQREEVLKRMLAALKPGGWLLLEEFGGRLLAVDPPVPSEISISPLMAAVGKVLATHGADSSCGLRLPGQLRALGLLDIGSEGRVLLFQGGSSGTTLYRTNALLVRDEIISSGLMTAADFERELERLNDPDLMIRSQVMWTTWGRRPE